MGYGQVNVGSKKQGNELIELFLVSIDGTKSLTSDVLSAKTSDTISYSLTGGSFVQQQWDSYSYLEGSNDNSTWTTIDSLHVVATSVRNEKNSTTGYKYYRLRATVKGDTMTRSFSNCFAFIGLFQ